MIKTLFFVSSRRWMLLIALAALAAAGCSSGPAWLTFRSTQNQGQYAQKFNRAYFTRTDRGEYQAVLVEDGLNNAAPKTGPISATTSAPLSQVVHVRVMWRPLRGSKPDTPSATNAIIDWYVRSTHESAGDLLHYRGAGFVTIYDSTSTARFVIRNAQVALADGGGALRDPLGDSSLSGSFVAERQDGMVQSTLENLNTAAADAPAAPGAHDGPPPRSPAGP